MSTRKPKKPFRDPMAEREKQKYEHPIPSREAVLALLTERNEPMPFRTLADTLGAHGERDEDAFSRRLRAMERDGQRAKNPRAPAGLIIEVLGDHIAAVYDFEPAPPNYPRPPDRILSATPNTEQFAPEV